jgi:hypothetical protein
MLNETDRAATEAEMKALDRKIDSVGEQMRDANRDYKENGIPQTKMRALALESEFSKLEKDD